MQSILKAKKVLKLCICVTISVACVFVFASCASQNSEPYDESCDYENGKSAYCQNEVSGDATSVLEATEHEFCWITYWRGNSPWRADYNIESMPVFRNHFHILPSELHGRFSANKLSAEEMIETAKNILIAMGHEVRRANKVELSLWEIEQNVEFREVVAVSESAIVTIGRSGGVTVQFLPGLALPDGIIFSYGRPQDEAIEYLMEKFAPALGIETRIFENNKDDIIDRILDYHFNVIRFKEHPEGRLSGIIRPVFMDVILADKVGYFPIITPDEAIEIMLSGQGMRINWVEYETFLTCDCVVDIQLMYFGSDVGIHGLEYFVPWYRIIVNQPDWLMPEVYFVPAIQADYLEANPAWSVLPH